MKKKVKKTLKKTVEKKVIKNYIVVVSGSNNPYLFYMWGDNTSVEYFEDLLEVNKFIKKLDSGTKVSVFKVAEEIGVKNKLELDLK